jgi:hypothetical protein
MKSFWDGFEKQALYGKKSDELGLGAVYGRLPLGTTIQTSMADRPKEHSRVGEWGRRVAGGFVGALGGSLIGGLPGALSKNPSLARIGASVGGLGGAIAGEGLGHNSAIRDYYDAKGDIKSKYKKHSK